MSLVPDHKAGVALLRMIVLALMALMLVYPECQGSGFRVVSFTVDELDVSALRNEKKDANNYPCAIIKVTSAVAGISFEANLGIVDLQERQGETWIWVSKGEKRLRIFREGFISLDYDLPLPVRSSAVYKMVIDCVDCPVVNASIQTGSFSIESDPPGALISITGMKDFNLRMNRTPFLIDEMITGPKRIMLTLDRYDTIIDTINIDSRKRGTAKFKMQICVGFVEISSGSDLSSYTIMVDGVAMTGAQTGLPFELRRGLHKVEIAAPHYYTADTTITVVAGLKSLLRLQPKPVMGSLTIEGDENSKGAEVFLNGISFGFVPLLRVPVQEGTYAVTAFKKGFGMKDGEITVVISEKREQKVDLNMVNRQRITITTVPDDAMMTFDGKIQKGSSPFGFVTGIGSHRVRVTHTDYYPFESDLEVIPGKQDYFVSLEARKLQLSIQTKKNLFNQKTRIFIDGRECGTDFGSTELVPGVYAVEIRNEKNTRRILKVNVHHPVRKQPVKIRIPGKTGMSLINLYYEIPRNVQPSSVLFANPTYAADILQYSAYGFSFSMISIQRMKSPLFPDQPIVGSLLTNPCFRMGGNITPWADISVFGEYSYSYTFLETEPGKESTSLSNSEYRYGGALTLYPWVGGLIGFVVKAGMKNSHIEYRIFDGFENGPKHALNESGYYVQVGVHLVSSVFDGKILRLWRRPWSDIGRY